MLPDAISLNEIIDAFNAVRLARWAATSGRAMMCSAGCMRAITTSRKGPQRQWRQNRIQQGLPAVTGLHATLRCSFGGKLAGKTYLEMHPDSEIKRRYKIANAPQTQERKPKPLHEVKAIDPACGSGNFLLYAFDFFYELGVDWGSTITGLTTTKMRFPPIIENNLHGIDLDDRAVQLAQLGLFIKAKKKRRTIGELAFNVVSSDFYLPEYEAVEHLYRRHHAGQKPAGVDCRDLERPAVCLQVWFSDPSG